MLDVTAKYQKLLERMKVDDGGLQYALFEIEGGRAGLRPLNSRDWESVRYFMD